MSSFRGHRGRAATRYTTAITGTTKYACSILTLNASPIATALHTSGGSFPERIALDAPQIASTVSSTSSPSGLLCRAIATAIGVTASTSAASRPAACPKERRTRWCTTATVRTAHTACGTSRLHVLKPNARADRACTCSASGGLSTVMNEAASSEP